MTPLFLALTLFQSSPSLPPVVDVAAVEASIDRSLLWAAGEGATKAAGLPDLSPAEVEFLVGGLCAALARGQADVGQIHQQLLLDSVASSTVPFVLPRLKGAGQDERAALLDLTQVAVEARVAQEARLGELSRLGGRLANAVRDYC